MAGKFDFIEIGTSDFDTLIQTCTPSSRGLSVDALEIYLDRLPNKPNVTKVCCAVTGASVDSSAIRVFYVDPSDIAAFSLPTWIRGCNSVGEPHPTAMRVLQAKGLTHLCKTMEVPLVSIGALFKRYDVSAVDYLKLDTEGHDCVILGGLIEYCHEFPSCWPRTILFECNLLTQASVVDRTVHRLKTEGGYTLISKTETDIVMIRH